MLADCLTTMRSTANSKHLSNLGLEIKSSLELGLNLGEKIERRRDVEIPLLFFDNFVAAFFFLFPFSIRVDASRPHSFVLNKFMDSLDLEVRQDHAQSTRCLVMTKILNLLGGFVDMKIGPVRQVRVTRCPDQYGIEMQVPSTSKKNGSYSWNVISRGPNRYVDESWQDQEDPLHDVGMMSSSSVVEQSHSMTSPASKQQEQSIPMNYRSEVFIQINRRKWNDILACDNVERCSLAWKNLEKIDSIRTTSRTCSSRS